MIHQRYTGGVPPIPADPPIHVMAFAPSIASLCRSVRIWRNPSNQSGGTFSE
jgi:hypothetical protein